MACCRHRPQLVGGYRAGPKGFQGLVGNDLLSRMLERRPTPFQERGEDVCAQSTVKTRSKNIDVVTSNGRVTDTSSAETNLASHLTSCAWRLQQGVEASLCSSHAERESSRKSAETVVQDHGAVRTVGLATKQRPKPSWVIGRMRAASALSATTECLPAAAEML